MILERGFVGLGLAKSMERIFLFLKYFYCIKNTITEQKNCKSY